MGCPIKIHELVYYTIGTEVCQEFFSKKKRSFLDKGKGVFQMQTSVWLTPPFRIMKEKWEVSPRREESKCRSHPGTDRIDAEWLARNT